MTSGGKKRAGSAASTSPAPERAKRANRPGRSGAGDGSAAAEPPVDGVVGGPAGQRALRTQGRRTMRRLLDAAMKAIDERGYHATRVQDVVDIANTSHGTFYLYFSNKEDLVRALIVETSSQASRMSRTMSDAGGALRLDSRDELRRWVAGYSALWSRYSPLFRSWTDIAAIDDGIESQIRRMLMAHTEAVAEQIAAAGGAQDLDPQLAATAVVAMLDRFHFLREFCGEPVDDAAIDQLTTMIHRALFAEGA